MNNIVFCRVILIVALTIGAAHAAESPASGYDALIQQGKSQLQAGNAERAAASGKAAIKMSTERWEGYALVGGALMNLKRYEAAADTLSEAIKRAPEAKQPALRELRRQCLLAESGSPAVANTAAAASTTSQAEIVLWKSIENSSNLSDFQSYLDEYPQGAFAVLAKGHLSAIKDAAETINFVRDKSNAQGLFTYTVYVHDSGKRKDWTNNFSRELSKVDIRSCFFVYHLKSTQNGQITVDNDVEFNLHDVQEVLVETVETAMNRTDSKAHPERSDRVDPLLFSVTLRSSGKVNAAIGFREEETANRVAKSLVHAVELCGGGKQKVPDSPMVQQIVP